MSHLRFSLPVLLLACSALAACTGTASPRPASSAVTSAEDVAKNACDQDKFWERDGDYYESCHDGSTSAQLPAEEWAKAKAKAAAKAAASTSSSPCGKMCRESGGSRPSTQLREQRITAPAGHHRI